MACDLICVPAVAPESRLSGLLPECLLAAWSQGWTHGRPEELSIAGYHDDRATAAEHVCEGCGWVGGCVYFPLRRISAEPGYRALLHCPSCGVTEEF